MNDRNTWTTLAGSALVCGALILGSAQAQDYAAGEDDFDSDNYVEDRYGAYDADFDWNTDDEWYDTWNDTDLNAWNDTDEAQWDVLGYDGTDEPGLFD